MKLLCWILIVGLSAYSFAQQRSVQYFSFNEDNSSLESSVCYNWNQLPSGEIFVSGNGGIARFDGKKFHKFPTQGRGKAISSSAYDPSGTLWCNTFHGDIFFLKNGEFVRHPISEKIKEITFFKKVGGNFYLLSELEVYKLNIINNEFERIHSEDLIIDVFLYKNNVYTLYATKGAASCFSHSSGKRINIHSDLLGDAKIRTLNISGKVYFLLDKLTEKKLLLVSANEIIDGMKPNPISTASEGKINHVTVIDDEIVISGMNGIVFYNTHGKRTRKILSNMQVTHFGKDAEGNYLATTIGNGLVVIPNLNAYSFSYEHLLDNEFIIRTIQYDTNHLLHGTNGGKLILHHLISDEIKVLNFGKRSEVLAFTPSADFNTLYAYCDGLFEIDARTFDIKKEHAMTSIKNMFVFDKTLYLGSRNGLLYFDATGIQNSHRMGWNLSMIPIPQRKAVLLSSKKGLFLYHLSTEKLDTVNITGISPEKNIRNLVQKNNRIYFDYNFQEIYSTSIHLDAVSLVYKHPSLSVSGMNAIKNHFAVFLKDTVLLLTDQGDIERKITKIHGLNEPNTFAGFFVGNQHVFVHRKSLSIFRRFHLPNRVTPEVKVKIDPSSTFYNKNDKWISAYQDNKMVVNIQLVKLIRSNGTAEVFYTIDNAQDKWVKIENPFEPLQIDRLPIGSGKILLKVKNEDGIYSKSLSIPYTVLPPFYLTSWFIGLCVLIILIFILLFIRWRISLNQKKALQQLKKKQLEARALNAELTAIRSQMNPHFIFNVLTAIQSKVIEGKTDQAYKNIGDFATLIRNVLEKSGKEFISLHEEITLIKNYVSLENSRLNEPITLKVEIEDNEYFEDINIPTLITQPFVENAIKHAFPVQKKDKQVQFIIKRTVQGFNISIVDNGVGIENTKSNRLQHHTSFALEAMKQRIQKLVVVSQYHVDLFIDSDENGTSAKLIFQWKK